jgi:hypothetical protein
MSAGACSGILVGPIIMGLTIDAYPLALPYMVLVCLCSVTILSGVVAMIGSRDERQHQMYIHLCAETQLFIFC